MPYIWENYSKENRFSVGENVCPYMEVFSNTTSYVEINPLIRFTDFFELIRDEGFVKNIDNVKEFENIIIHYLAQLDMCKGLNYMQAFVEKIRDEIEKGYFGLTCTELWKKLDNKDKESLLYVLSQKLHHDNQTFFMDAIEKMFPLSSLSFEKKTSLFYLYLGVNETDYNISKLELVKYLFWNFQHELIVIWDIHYGIVGVDDAMHIDAIQIV